MEYIRTNKEAWEEAFENRINNFGEKTHERLLSDEFLPFISQSMKTEIQELNLQGKSIAQFCCNNGRELLALSKLGIASGVGFDIAENIINQAKHIAKEVNVSNCEFVSCNILDIPDEYNEKFDLIFFTIGAITWFQDLTLLFSKVEKCLKPGGKVLINDFHPIENMLALPGEHDFDMENLNRFVYSYFRDEPWIETNGMSYISGEYPSKTFTSFSHTLSSIINSLSKNGLKTVLLNEYEFDIGLTDVYDYKGIPLSFSLIAEKNN